MNVKQKISVVMVLAGALLGFGTVANAAQNYVADPGVVAYSNATGSAINSGDLVDLGDRYGVALSGISTAAVGSVKTDGQWKFNRTTTNAISAGASLYRSTATSVTVTASADAYLGQSVSAAPEIAGGLTGAEYVELELNALQRQSVFGGTGITGTNSIAVAVTNFVITVIEGRITALTVNGTTF